MLLKSQFRSKYPIERHTTNLGVPYYVKENFHSEYQGSVRRLEVTIEEEYLANLRHACFREKNYRKFYYVKDFRYSYII